MDTRDLQASLGRAEAQMQVSQRAVEESRALLEQQKTQVELARSSSIARPLLLSKETQHRNCWINAGNR